MDKERKMEEALNSKLPANPIAEADIASKEIQSDYELSRNTYRDLISKGSSAMDMLMEVASDSEHPRAYEVLSKLMKDIGDNTDKLMDLQIKKKDMLKSEKPVEHLNGGTTNNNVFIGSTSDLQRMLMQANKDIIDVDGS